MSLNQYRYQKIFLGQAIIKEVQLEKIRGLKTYFYHDQQYLQLKTFLNFVSHNDLQNF